MKLILSMPGVPSATPAQENSASTGPPQLVERGVDRVLLGQVDVDGLDARQGDLGEVHDHDVGAGVLHQLGGGGAHAGGTADDERALAVVPECVEQTHDGAPLGSVSVSIIVRSRDDAADLEVDDGVPVEPELAEDVIAVLVELGRPLGLRGLLVVLHRRGHQLEGCAARGLAVLHVAVGDALRIGDGFERVLHDGPLPDERLEARRATRRAWPPRRPR